MDFSLFGLTLTSAILANLWTDAEGLTAHGCRGGQVRLNCSSGTVLISEVVLADSSCFRSNCCPQQNDCRGSPSVAYRDSVLRSCNGKASCVVDVEIRKIGCSAVFPNNDYARISYECQEPETTETTLHLRSTSYPVVASSTVAPLQSVSTHNNTEAAKGVSNGLKTMSEKDEEEEEEKKRAEITISVPDQLEVEVTSPAPKPVLVFHQMTELVHSENEAPKQVYKDNSQPPDRMVAMTSLIVGCIVIVTTVIAAAVVMTLKKRRVPKSTPEQALVMTDGLCASAAEGGGGEEGEVGGRGGGEGGGEENCRNSNIYELIPDNRVGGGGGGGGGGEGGDGDDAVKENEYLRPMMDDEDRPYFWVP